MKEMNSHCFVHAFTKSKRYAQWSKCSKLSVKIEENFATFFSKPRGYKKCFLFLKCTVLGLHKLSVNYWGKIKTQGVATI